MTFVLLHEFKAEKYLADEPYTSHIDRERYRYVLHPVWLNMTLVVEMRLAPESGPTKSTPEGKPSSTTLIVPEGGGHYSVAETPEQILQALRSIEAQRGEDE